MADKSFEERVKDELGVLELKPEEAVWHQVEATLHTRKKRRWLFWLLPLLAGMASFWLYNQYHGKKINRPRTNEQSITVKESATKVTGPAQSSSNKKRPVEPATQIILKENVDTHSEKRQSHRESISLDHGKKFAVPPVTNSLVLQKQSPIKEADTAKQFFNEIQDRANEIVIEKQMAEKIITDSAVVKVQNLAKLAMAFNQDTVVTVKDTDPRNSSMSQKQIRKHRWQLFGMLALGISGQRNSIINNGNAYAASGQANNLNSGFYTGSTVFKKPSGSDAWAFGLGIQAVKQVGRKSSIGISAGYSFYSYGIGVGRRVDSTINLSNLNKTNDDGFYFISTDSTRYLNKYHFADLAVDWYTNYQLSKVLSLRWRIGAGTAVLLSGNALHYDAATGILFKNRSLLSAVQLNISTGFDFGIGKHPNVYVGPQFTYFISSNSKQFNTSQHLLRVAIGATVGLSKKKK